MDFRNSFFCVLMSISLFVVGCKSGNSEGDSALPVPQISSISPTNSCGLGPVSISGITGSHFSDGISVMLTKEGETDIEAANVVVVNANTLSCDFDITGAAEGEWTVWVSNASGSDELAHAFTVTNALYVSTAGDDAHVGTASSPKLTMQSAIDASSSGQHVRVSEGTYNISENIEIKQNVSLSGGYDTVTWERDLVEHTTTLQDTRASTSGNVDLPHTVVYAGSGITTETIVDGFTIKGTTAGGADYTSAVFCDTFSSGSNNGLTLRNNIIDGGGGSSVSYGVYLRGYIASVIEGNIINGGTGGYSYGIYGRLLRGSRVMNNTIDGGSCSGSSSYGLYFRQGSDVYIYNNVVYGGNGYHSYGVYSQNNSGRYVAIQNNTIDGGLGDNNYSYGIYVSASEPYIDNNIIFCTGTTYAYGIFEYNAAGIPASVNNNDIFACETALYRQYDESSPVSLTDISDLNALSFADSNISIDPSFYDTGNDDYHLTASSSTAVTSGGLNGTGWTYFPENDEGNPVDKDGLSRPAGGSAWAIGAYEYKE